MATYITEQSFEWLLNSLGAKTRNYNSKNSRKSVKAPKIIKSLIKHTSLGNEGSPEQLYFHEKECVWILFANVSARRTLLETKQRKSPLKSETIGIGQCPNLVHVFRRWDERMSMLLVLTLCIMD